MLGKSYQIKKSNSTFQGRRKKITKKHEQYPILEKNHI
jgi:hypothetical protein